MPFIIEWVTACFGPETAFMLDTPAGGLAVFVCGDVITRSDWLSTTRQTSSHPFQQTLSWYWQNPQQTFNIKLLAQGSAYRRKVWAQLDATAIGETITYAAIAKHIGSAARAVGNACRDNPYPLFIPCHRVVANQGLGGYCGQKQGDLVAIKTRLLAFEAQFTP